jgi:ATP-binding cassette subfamily B protein
MEKGQLVEQGTHDELMAKKGHYFDLYASQFTQALN